MTQNVYDDEKFFENYGQLRRSVEGLEGAQEWASMRALLPDLRGKRVLDLGCGYGWFCRWARENGAANVLGVDVSEKMLARARETTNDTAIEYVRGDIEMFELPIGSFDLVYSSLAFHYVEDFDTLVEAVHRWLAAGGSFVFSVEHPIMTAPSDAKWLSNAAGEKSWPVDHYFDEGFRSTDWLAKGVVKQHRTVATYLNTLLRCGFALAQVEEWRPSEEQVASWPSLADDRQRPSFLLVAARR